MRNRMTAKVLVAAAIGAAAVAAGVPAVYGTTATLVNNNNAYPLSATLNANSNIINGTLANSWSGGVVPGAAGDTINFNYDVASFMNNATDNVMLNNNTTVGILNLQGDAGVRTQTLLSTLNNTKIIMDNGAGQAQINFLSTNRAIMNLNSSLQLNSDVVVNVNGGPLTMGFTGSGHNIATTSAAGKNLIIEGGGMFNISGGVGFTQNQIHVNNGIVKISSTSGTDFGTGASAGIYIAQGATLWEQQLQFGSSNNWAAPVHIIGTGYKLNGAYHNQDPISATASLVLDGDAWYVGSQGGGAAVISESVPGSRLFITFTADPYRMEGIGAQLHTLRGQNTYTGGTTILPFAWGGFVGTGYGKGSVDVKATGTFVAEGLANLYDAPGGLGDGSARVLLEPGYKINQLNGFSSTAVANPNGDFTSVGGRFQVAADFDPTLIIDAASSGGVVALGANNSQSFNVASWGDGTIRLGAYSYQANGVSTAVTPVLYTGTVSAISAGNPVTLNLGYTGSLSGVGANGYGLAPLQFESSISSGNVAGVSIKAGVIAFDNSNTYTGDTVIGYDGTLNILSGSTSQASAIKVNAAGTLNMIFGGGNINTAITVNGGGTATLGSVAAGFGGAASGGITVSGFNPSTVVGPANGPAFPYRGLVNYNTYTSGGGSVTVNAYGQVTFDANVGNTGANVITLNDLGVMRAIPTTFDANVGTASLVINPGAVLYNNLPLAASTLPGSFTTANLGTLGDKYYGIGNGTNANAGMNWTIGTTSGTPWKGLAGGADAGDFTDVAPNANSFIITLSGSADLVGLANGLGNSTAVGGGDGNSVGGNSLTVNHVIAGTLSGSDKLTIRGGGTVVFNNNLNTFTAPVVVDAAQLSADLGAWDTYLGAATNTITLKNGGKLLIGTGVTLPVARTITVDTGGGALGVGGNTTAPQVLTIGAAGQLTGSTKFTKYGNGTLALTADTGLTGPVSVVGGTLQLTDPTALQTATSLTLGTAQAALVSPFLNVASAGFPVANVTSGNFGALLLDKATLDAGTYKLNGGTMTLANVPLNGGAIGFTGDASLTFAGLNLGTQTYLSSLSVKPVENDSIATTGGNYTGVIQGVMQSVKILHLGGYSPNVAGTMTFSDAITDSGGPVMLMKGGHNVTLNLNAGGANTYTGGTYIYDGTVNVSNANQLGTGAIELTGAYSTNNAAANEGILHITDNVTFGANQFFRFQGTNSTAIGTPLGGTTGYAPYINVDSGKTAIINAIDNQLTPGGGINKIGLGTLRVNIAQNQTVLAGDTFSAYLGGGNLELDSLPYSLGGGTRTITFDGNSADAAVGGTLTVHAPPAAAEFGFVLNSAGYGFTRQEIRDTKVATVNIDSGATYAVRAGSASNWLGTLVINGADLTSLAMFSVATSSVAATNANGVLDIHGGRVSVINDNTSGGMVIPWQNPLFTLKLQGGELDGNDFQNSTARTTLPTSTSFINANVVINSAFSAPIIGGAYPTTIAGDGTTSWVGALTKNGSGILTFNRNNGSFTTDATTSLTINNGQVVVDGNGAFDSASFQANHVPIINNSLTDTGSDAGIVFANTTGSLTNDIRWADSITGSGGIQVTGVILHLGASPSSIDAGLLRLTTNTVSGLGGRVRLDGDNNFADPYDAVTPTTPTQDVTLHANVPTALVISGNSTLMAHNVTLANTSSGGVLDGTLVAHSLTISGTSGSFTQDAGSTLNLNGVTAVINNGTFTYNGGTTNVTSITPSAPNIGTTVGTTVVNGATLTLDTTTIDQGSLQVTTNGNSVGQFRNDNLPWANTFNSAAAGTVTLHANSATALRIDAGSEARLGDVTLAGNSSGGPLNGTLVAHGLTISSANGTFTQNAGSSLTLTTPVVTNNGTFTYNGGTTNATAINSTTPTGQLVLNANLALSEVRQSVKVQVNANSALTLTASGGPTTGGTDANVSRMGSLVLSGAADAWTSKLDVNDNKVIIDNANSAVAAATYTQTNNQLKQGFDNGAWDGQGIVSTKAQTNVNNGVPVTIGVINNDDGSGNPAFFHDGTDLPQFGGQNVNGTAVLTKYTYFGDADLSGTVDAVDYTFFVAGVQSGGTLTGWEWGDFDYSGTIDAVDYTFFVFGVQGQGAALAGGGSGPTSVPEPASLALLGLGGLLMLKRRNRKS